MPKVTIGVPTYNRAAHLGHALAQILGQDFRDIEVIVSDDASTDSTPDVVRNFRDQRLVYRRNESNLRIPGNLNAVLERAKGEYIIFLHDHDSFHPSLISQMVRVLEARPEIGFVFSGLAWTDHLGQGYRELLEELPPTIPKRELVRNMLESRDFSCPVNACGMVRRSTYEAMGGRYDDRFGFLSDVDMWYRIGLEFDIGYIRQPLITCKAREPGHEFGALNWQLIRWTLDIHRTNLERYCALEPGKRSKLQQLYRAKANRVLFRSMLRAIASGDRRKWHEGLDCLADHGSGAVLLAAHILRRIPSVFISALLAAGHAVRQRLRATA